MKHYKITAYCLLAMLMLWQSAACAQTERHLYVNAQKKTNTKKGEFATVNDALRQAETYAADGTWTTIHIAPGVYWIDNPDDPAIRRPEAGDKTPFGMKVRLNKTRLIGTGNHPEDTQPDIRHSENHCQRFAVPCGQSAADSHAQL